MDNVNRDVSLKMMVRLDSLLELSLLTSLSPDWSRPAFGRTSVRAHYASVHGQRRCCWGCQDHQVSLLFLNI